MTPGASWIVVRPRRNLAKCQLMAARVRIDDPHIMHDRTMEDLADCTRITRSWPRGSSNGTIRATARLGGEARVVGVRQGGSRTARCGSARIAAGKLTRPRLGHRLQSAWVGDMRAALLAGKSPARAPMRTAAASPPSHA